MHPHKSSTNPVMSEAQSKSPQKGGVGRWWERAWGVGLLDTVLDYTNSSLYFGSWKPHGSQGAEQGRHPKWLCRKGLGNVPAWEHSCARTGRGTTTLDEDSGYVCMFRITLLPPPSVFLKIVYNVVLVLS